MGVLFAASLTTLTGVWSAVAAMCIADFMPSTEARGKKRAFLLTIAAAFVSYMLANILVDVSVSSTCWTAESYGRVEVHE